MLKDLKDDKPITQIVYIQSNKNGFFRLKKEGKEDV